MKPATISRSGSTRSASRAINRRAEHGAERHRAADDADVGAVAPEPLDDEDHEQHDEPALGDLRDAPDRHARRGAPGGD